MVATPVQLTGGGFQDFAGNPLANGYLILELNDNASVEGVGYIGSGVKIKITLDSNGNVASGQNLWGNDALSPGTYYRVTAYSSKGLPVWGPNCQTVTGSGTFNLGTWIPNRR